MSSDALPMVFAKHAVKFVRPDQAVVGGPGPDVKVKKVRKAKVVATEAPVGAPAPDVKVPGKKVRKAKIAAAPDTSAITPMTAPPVLEADVPAPVKARTKKVTAPAVVAAVPALPSEPEAKPTKKKRAPTAYNIAVGLHMKAGKTMKEAAALAKADTAKSA